MDVLEMEEDAAEVRRYVQKAFSTRCVYLSKDALSYLSNFVKDVGDREERHAAVNRVIEVVGRESGEMLCSNSLLN